MNEVKGGKHYFADYIYGGSDAGLTLAEPKEEEASALYLDANFENSFKIDDISSVFHYELIAESGGLNSYMTGEKKGEMIGSDGVPHEGEITSLPLAFSISLGSEDHYLDVDFAKKVPDLDYEFCDELGCDELGVGSLRSDILSLRASNEEVGVSESPVLAPQCFNDQFENTNTVERHGNSREKCRYERSVEDQMGTNSSLTCDIHDFQDSNDDRSTLAIGSSFGHEKHKKDLSLISVEAPCTSICTHDEFGPVSPCTELQDFSADDVSTDSCAETKIVRVRQRRHCKPPQRYLDGFQWFKSRLERAKNHSSTLLKDKDFGVKSQKKNSKKALKRKASRTRAKKLEHGSDEEYEPLMSCLNTKQFKRRIDRRKVSQPWSLDEVVSLVNGMSEFGVGQWTAVKRAYFLVSRRTATDIRDKWRNLVKTNCRSSNVRKDDQNSRSSTQSLPKPLIERVRELANAPVLMPRGKRGKKPSRS